MPIPTPKLDLRTFDQLLSSAKETLKKALPDWNDQSVHDPGIVLLEAFAHLTEMLIYRVNRLPENAHVEFLRLIGVQLAPAAAAVTTLRFELKQPQAERIVVPAGTRVTTAKSIGGGENPIFATTDIAYIEPNKTFVEVTAYHCRIETEKLGVGNNSGGQSFTASRPFVIAGVKNANGLGTRDNKLDLLVGVEVSENEVIDRAPSKVHDGKTFRIWQEVESFALLRGLEYAFVADRAGGKISFAPLLRDVVPDGQLEPESNLMAKVPPMGKEIRIWGPRGGGPSGNLPANSLRQLLDPIPGTSLDVTNPKPSSGGMEAESLANALLRGPMAYRTVERAVTAMDYEWLAERASGAVQRAKAFTKSDLWCFADPGTVEVVLVPVAQKSSGGRIDPKLLASLDNQPAKFQVQNELNNRKALGTNVDVHWTRYKPVAVKAELIVHPQEQLDVVKNRLLDRLHESINPLSETSRSPTWHFGTSLRSTSVFDIIRSDPGVIGIKSLPKLCVNEAPDEEVYCIECDPFQDQTWYAGSGLVLYRSVNDAASWEPVHRIEEGRYACLRSHPLRPGLLAVATRYISNLAGGGKKIRSRVFLSWDCGESWKLLQETAEVNDIAWLPVRDDPVILIATDDGFFRGPVQKDRSGDLTVPIAIIDTKPDHGIYSVVSVKDPQGHLHVAVALSLNAGVFLSNQGGEVGTFRSIGPNEQKNIQNLSVQTVGTRSWLWAAISASAGEGEGCMRWELRGQKDPPEGWVEFKKGWKGGSCFAVGFLDDVVLGASHNRGVLKLDIGARNPSWKVDEEFQSGLPTLTTEHLFQPVRTLAVKSSEKSIVMTGGPKGVYRSLDGGIIFASRCSKEFTDEVSIPKTWLICSAEHHLEVEYENA